MDDSLWSRLPYDIIKFVASCLDVPDKASAAMVCKWWRHVLGSIYSQKSSQPLLVHLWPDEALDQNYRMFDPRKSVIYTSQICSLPKGDIEYCNYGWLWIHRMPNDLLLNPFTGSTIDLPPAHKSDYSTGYCFFSSFPETLEDLIVFTFTEIEEYLYPNTWYVGDEDWNYLELVKESGYKTSNANPVYHEGLLHVLGMDGIIGVFDPEEEEFKLLDEPKGIEFRDFEPQVSYFLKFEGELYSVFTSYFFGPIHIFKLETSPVKQWRKVEDLGTKTLFLTPRQAVMVQSQALGDGSMANKVYLSIIHGQRHATDAQLSFSHNHLFFEPSGTTSVATISKFPTFISQVNCQSDTCIDTNGCVYFSFEDGKYHPPMDKYCHQEQNSAWVFPNLSGLIN